jgi:hypothetical protein
VKLQLPPFCPESKKQPALAAIHLTLQTDENFVPHRFCYSMISARRSTIKKIAADSRTPQVFVTG